MKGIARGVAAMRGEAVEQRGDGLLALTALVGANEVTGDLVFPADDGGPAALGAGANRDRPQKDGGADTSHQAHPDCPPLHGLTGYHCRRSRITARQARGAAPQWTKHCVLTANRP
jgi:hypothetical protein